MKNNKGFTLAELLVVLGIITLITIMVFPAISKMWSNNEKKKLESYQKMTAEFAEADRQRGTVSLCDLGKSVDLEEVKKDCIGYVIENSGVYKAYLYCERYDYKTKYDEQDDYDKKMPSIAIGKCN